MPSDLRCSVAYSQNFLRSGRLVDRLLARSEIDPEDLVLEIGPGKGIITERLARACRQVLAIEKDPKLARQLQDRLAALGNVALFEADALSFPLPLTSYKVFANIPFNATAAIVTRLTTDRWAPLDAYLVVQREAAIRYLGQPKESLSALLLKPWFEPTLIHRFQPSDFLPPPHVEVVMLRLWKRGPPLVAGDNAELFRDFIVFAFTAWQPTVRVALARGVGTDGARQIERRSGVDLGRSPTSVRFEEWLDLFAAFVELDEQVRRAVYGAESRLRAEQAGLRKVHRSRTFGRTR